MLSSARDFFTQRNVLEVETPMLSMRATMDPNIASVEVKISGQNAYLCTSPEYYMKRLLAAGYADIYQISRVFRDAESGRHHLPEFTMAEWYRLNYSLDQIMAESADFIAALLGDKCTMESPVYVTYTQAFEKTLNLNPLTAQLESILAATNADAGLVQSLGNDRNAWLDLAMSQQVSNAFHADRLTIVYHYPATQASLARQCPGNARLADRFEIYLGSLELANGFVELMDSGTQQRRFEDEQRIREAKGLPVHQIDEDLVAALAAGLPQCAGVAIGIDRLLMIREELAHIEASTTFSPVRTAAMLA